MYLFTKISYGGKFPEAWIDINMTHNPADGTVTIHLYSDASGSLGVKSNLEAMALAFVAKYCQSLVNFCKGDGTNFPGVPSGAISW